MAFVRQETVSLISGRPQIQRVLEHTTFRVVSTEGGILIDGESPIITSLTELETYAEAIGEAWADHARLVEKQRAILMGKEVTI